MQKNMTEIIGVTRQNKAKDQTIFSILKSIVADTAAIIATSHAEKTIHPEPACRSNALGYSLSGRSRGIKYLVTLLRGMKKYAARMTNGVINVMNGNINLVPII
jgi:hypothetical protein